MQRRDPLDSTDGPVVVGVDGSDTALSAVCWAVQEAHARGTGLQVVHAAPYAAGPDRGPRDHATGILGRAITVARRTDPAVTVRSARLDGAPVAGLLEASRGAQLLVVGMPGHGRPGEIMVRSTALAVAAQASCATVVVHRDSAGSGGEVVVGVADPEVDAGLVGLAHACARRYGSSVRVVHAGRIGDGDRERLETLVSRWDARTSAVAVRLEVSGGGAANVLLSRARAARLMVVGRRARRVHVLTGSTTLALVRSCTTPVLVASPQFDQAPPATARTAGDPHRREELW